MALFVSLASSHTQRRFKQLVVRIGRPYSSYANTPPTGRAMRGSCLWRRPALPARAHMVSKQGGFSRKHATVYRCCPPPGTKAGGTRVGRRQKPSQGNMTELEIICAARFSPLRNPTHSLLKTARGAADRGLPDRTQFGDHCAWLVRMEPARDQPTVEAKDRGYFCTWLCRGRRPTSLRDAIMLH